MILTGPGASVQGVRRKREAYTWGIDSSLDNDATFVTVHETASGRGELVSVFCHHVTNDTTGWTVKITIDGGAAVEKVLTSEAESGEPVTQSLSCFAAFASSLKVEMKLTDAQTAWFGAVTNIE